MTKIPTFAQYVHTMQDDARKRHGLSWQEVREELPKERYWQEWRDYVVKSYNNGGEFTPQHWAKLDKDLVYRIKRTHRYLSR